MAWNLIQEWETITGDLIPILKWLIGNVETPQNE